ncbi:hypothetical protein [Methanosarcina sp. UBA5]|uniref:hypothetical protein n=1 Tax=Methanosarcina sp. UBA5 TaxID=1915593 RepID=UPI0025EA398F|nr:hypothetical protein [Methanosarcina sp. UBA5]
MVKPGIIKPVLLLVFIGIIIAAFVQPIAGSTMGKGKLMEQKDKMVPCPENKIMMQSGMKERAANETCETSSTEKMESMMEEKSCNETMTGSMMREKLANKNCYNESSSEANFDRANLWLKKAIKLHAMHLENPKSVTNESQMEMMDEMKQAKKYLAGEKMNMGMMSRATGNISAEYEHPYVIPTLMRLECSEFWLDEAIKLHAMHMKNPKIATNESQVRLMVQMVRANRYLAREDMDMEMAKNASLSQDNVDFTTLWLEKAMKLHAMNLKNPEAATNESQMRLMNQMMRARECIEGKGMNLEMLMDLEEDSAREMCEPSSKEMCEPSPREKMMTMMMGSMKMGEKSCNETMMNTMKSNIMEEKGAKKEKMESMMEEKEAKKGKMESMMEGKEAKKENMKSMMEEKMESMMEEKGAKKENMKSMMEEKMESMKEEKLANESCYTGEMDKKAILTRANFDCVCSCLEKAMKLHEMNLKNPEAATSESKMEMMKQMMQAHEYLTGEKMNMDMMEKAIGNESAGKLKEKADYLSAEKSGQCSTSKMGEYSSTEQSKRCSSGGC